MFHHSVPVPRIYKAAAKIAKAVTDHEGSIKQLVYGHKHFNIKALYALVAETLRHTDDIQLVLTKSKLLTKEPRFDPWLAKILITELLWGKGRLLGEAKPIKTILAYEQIFKAHISDNTGNHQIEVEVPKPRYVRVNTILISTQEAIEAFREEGWIFARFMGKSYDDFLKEVASMSSEEFTVDFHVPDLLLFPPKTAFYNHSAYKTGKIILQDKASCLPVCILKPEPGSTVLDMCAAPGMKTTQIAALLHDEGKVFAVEKDQKRFSTLNTIVEASGATCVETINRDVLTLTETNFPNVDYILVDPSCSGSGATSPFDSTAQSNAVRLSNLVGFQKRILGHALNRFSNAKRVVYSTCSNNSEENENVVWQVLETTPNFKLVPADKFIKSGWINFGSPKFEEIGGMCLYAKPDVDLTHQFFIAVFERLAEGEQNPFYKKEFFRPQKEQNTEPFGEETQKQNYQEESGRMGKKSNKRKKLKKDGEGENENSSYQLENYLEAQEELEEKSNNQNEEDLVQGFENKVEANGEVSKKRKKHDVEEKEKSSKRKKMKKDDEGESSDNQLEGHVEVKKKLKRKTNNQTEEKTVEGFGGKVEAKNRDVEKKKKSSKRQKDDKDESKESTLGDNQIEDNVEVEEELKKKSGKRKKVKNYDENESKESTLGDNQSEDHVEVKEELIKKSSKKRRHLKEIDDGRKKKSRETIIEEEPVDSVDVSSQRKEKKHKRKPIAVDLTP